MIFYTTDTIVHTRSAKVFLVSTVGHHSSFLKERRSSFGRRSRRSLIDPPLRVRIMPRVASSRGAAGRFFLVFM